MCIVCNILETNFSFENTINCLKLVYIMQIATVENNQISLELYVTQLLWV